MLQPRTEYLSLTMEDNSPTPQATIQAAAMVNPELAQVLGRFYSRKLNPGAEHRSISIEEKPALPRYAQLPEGLGIDACPWMDRYIDFSRRWSPRSFDDYHEACAVWILSVVAARRVKTEFGGPRFTPLYIILSGRSSFHAKTTTANIANATLRTAGLNYILAPDQSTPQKFISLLSGRLPDNYDQLSVERKELLQKRFALLGARGWFHEEFGSHVSSMMQPNSFMADFRGLLRKFDDCPDHYETATVTRDLEMIERPYLALLGNLTPADLRRFAQKGSELWGDGFLARFAIVGPGIDAGGKTGRFPSGERMIPSELIQPLQDWDRRLGHGQVVISPKIVDEKGKEDLRDRLKINTGPVTTIVLNSQVNDAYYRYLDGLTQLAQEMDNADLDGNYIRFPEKALRISCLLASLADKPEIEMMHWARAQAITERWRAGLHGLYNSVNNDKSIARENEEKVLRIVQKLGCSTPTEVGRYIRGLSTGEVRLILEDLATALVLEKSREGKAERYGFPIEP